MSSSFTITEDEQARLCELARTSKDKKTADRVRIVLALAAGDRVQDVARIFCIDEPTVRRWKNRYQKRRLFSDWLATLQKGYSGKLTNDQLAAIEAYVETEMVADAAVVVAFIKDRFDQEYTIDGVTKLLHRLGFVYKQTTLVPGKLDEAAQAAWLKGYEKLKSKLPENETILFGDGVHPSHNVHATKAWIKKGEQKRVPTNTGRKRLNINGVLNIEDMQAVVHYADTLNAQTTMELFDRVQAAYPDKKKIHLIVDNASYYKNKELQAYLRKRKCRIKIHWLPPYSPNLNFIERLWHFMKKYIIGVKRRQTFKEFEADIKTFFDNLKDYEDRLRQFIGMKLHLIQAA